MKKEKRALILPLFLVSTIMLIVISAFAGFYILSYKDTMETITFRQMKTLGAALSLSITAEELDKYYNEEIDMYSDDYKDLVKELNKAVYGSDINFAYIFRYSYRTNKSTFIVGNVFYTPEDLNMPSDSTYEDILNHLLVDHRETHLDFAALNSSEIEMTEDVFQVLNGESIVVDYNRGHDGPGNMLTAFTPIYYNDGTLSNYIVCVEKTNTDITGIERTQNFLFILFGISLVAAIITATFSFRQYSIQAKASTKANDAKSGFLSRMSHEIRTPMNAIIGMTKIAEKTEDTDKLDYCISTIENSSTHLLQLINDVLDVSKIEAGKFLLDNEMMNLEKMLMKLCNIFLVQADDKKLDFNIIFENDMKMHYITDELRLSQILNNLISNAIKFTPENGKITVKIKELQREDNYSVVQFVVSDTGIGISEKQVEKIRESFEMENVPISDKFGGSGLGLVICKTIVEKMGGKIYVESEVGEGSTFTFTVKMERPSDQVKASLISSIKPDDIKLLIAEHDEVLRGQLSKIIRGFKINPDEVSTSSATVERVTISHEKNTPYDVIIIDYDLPDMNGIDTINSLSDLIDKNTIIIVTTFANYNEVFETATGISIDKFIAKPFFPSSVLDAINEALSKSTKLVQNVTKGNFEYDFSNKHILLAEDVEINRIIFSSLLEGTGINIDIAEHGLEAVNMFTLNPTKYDLIVMDVQMPKMDGLEATSTIRGMSSRYAKQIPIIAMTANAFKEDVDNCINAGMSDHVAKPIDEKVLVEKLYMYFGQYDRTVIE